MSTREQDWTESAKNWGNLALRAKELGYPKAIAEMMAKSCYQSLREALHAREEMNRRGRE